MNPSLLFREPTATEQVLQNSLRKVLPTIPQMAFTDGVWRSLGLDGPEPFFAAILSLVPMPPTSPFEFSLCRFLLGIPKFLYYMARPEHFERPALAELSRLMMRIDMRFDIKLITALAEDATVDRETFLRILSVLDEISPGGRLTLTLTRVLRDSEPMVAAKVEMLLNRRVSNPMLLQRQLTSDDPRTRANAIESLWGVDTAQNRRSLERAARDSDNRVSGNALVGLYMLGDTFAVQGIRNMAGHSDPMFRATAAWAMAKTGNVEFRPLIEKARTDPDPRVRSMADRALEMFPEPEAVAVGAEGQRDGDPKQPGPAKDDIPIRLDGTWALGRYRRIR